MVTLLAPQDVPSFGSGNEVAVMDLLDRGDQMRETMTDVSGRVADSVGNVLFAGQFWYETQVAFSSQYQETLDALTTGISQKESRQTGGEVWTGQSIRQGLEGANRQLREAASREPGRHLLGGISLGRSSRLHQAALASPPPPLRTEYY